MNHEPHTLNLIDTHAHLMWPDFTPDFQEVLKRCFETGVKTVINVGADLQTSLESINLDCSPLKSFSSIGIHPHEIKNLTSTESIHKHIEKMGEIAQKETAKIIAIGECGLDYFFGQDNQYLPPASLTNRSPLSIEEVKILQKETFRGQIRLAKDLKLPLIIHNRDSWEDIFIPELNGTRGVFHSFTGTKEQAQKVLDLGFYLGLNCTVTYPKNEHLREIIRSIPLEMILTETDCPFLPPQKIRGQRNEPANVLEAIRVIAEIKRLPIDKVAQIIYYNAQTLFKLS